MNTCFTSEIQLTVTREGLVDQLDQHLYAHQKDLEYVVDGSTWDAKRKAIRESLLQAVRRGYERMTGKSPQNDAEWILEAAIQLLAIVLKRLKQSSANGEQDTEGSAEKKGDTYVH